MMATVRVAIAAGRANDDERIEDLLSRNLAPPERPREVVNPEPIRGPRHI
jgi:hypothetical protein